MTFTPVRLKNRGEPGAQPLTDEVFADIQQSIYTAAVNDAGSVVSHLAVATVARPAISGPVTWVGSVPPVNAVDGDLWVDTSS